MECIQKAKGGFRSLTEAIDTTTSAGHMMMQMVGSFAEVERQVLRERTKTKAGLKVARRDGRVGRCRLKLKLKPEQQKEIIQMVMKGKKTAADAARLFGVYLSTVSRLLHRASMPA